MPDAVEAALIVLLFVVQIGHLLFTALSTGKKNDGIDTFARSELRKLDADMDDVFDRMKRLTSRKVMQARREEAPTAAKQQPGESLEDWKTRMRKLRQAGKFTPPQPHEEH